MEWAEIMRRRTMAFAIAVVKFSRAIPRTPENDVLKRQLTKAGTGIGANYRASCRSRSDDEWLARLAVAVEEADESEYWLTVMHHCDIGEATTRITLSKESSELTRVLTTSLQTSRARPAAKKNQRRKPSPEPTVRPSRPDPQ